MERMVQDVQLGVEVDGLRVQEPRCRSCQVVVLLQVQTVVVGHCCQLSSAHRRVSLLQHLETLVQVVVDGRERGDDGWRSEPVSDQREVGQVALDGRIQDLLRTGVAKRRSILVQQVHQFLENHPEKQSNETNEANFSSNLK